VHVDAVHLARELHRRDERHAALARVLLDLEVRGEVVVIADGEDVEAVRLRDVDDFLRRARAVRVIRVGVQVGVTQD
jgi:hypothetical protein